MLFEREAVVGSPDTQLDSRKAKIFSEIFNNIILIHGVNLISYLMILNMNIWVDDPPY